MICSSEQITLCRAWRSCSALFPLPDSGVSRQDTLDGAEVEIPQYLRGYLEFPQASEVKQSLSCLPHRRVRVQVPGQALFDVDTKVLLLHRGPVDDFPTLPKVHYHYFC